MFSPMAMLLKAAVAHREFVHHLDVLNPALRPLSDVQQPEGNPVDPSQRQAYG